MTILAADLDLANRAMGVMAGGAAWPASTHFAAPDSPVVAVPATLPALDARWQEAFHTAVEHAENAGVRIKRIDLSDFLAAAKLLYEGALVAERYDAVGEFISAASPSDLVDPTVAAIIGPADRFSATDLLSDRRRVQALGERAMSALGDATALLIPTAPMHPTLAEVEADPVASTPRWGPTPTFAICSTCARCPSRRVRSPKATDRQHNSASQWWAGPTTTQWCSTSPAGSVPDRLHPAGPGPNGRAPRPPRCSWWVRICAVSR
ncbi:hypothetical protein W823_24025 [Williamsia sp. D3]|nr:hypothetical protein W823_24025 [Williamsia sp. D3]